MFFALFMKPSLSGLPCLNTVATGLGISVMYQAVPRQFGCHTNKCIYIKKTSVPADKQSDIQWPFSHFIADIN